MYNSLLFSKHRVERVADPDEEDELL